MRMVPSLLILLILALIFRQAALALLAATVLVSIGVARLWQRWALQRVEYQRTLSHLRAFPGDEVILTITVTNRKLLPLAQLHIFDAIPSGVTVIDAPVIFSGSRQSSLIRRSTGLRWYERVIWRYRLRCDRRGRRRLRVAIPLVFFVAMRRLPPMSLYWCTPGSSVWPILACLHVIRWV